MSSHQIERKFRLRFYITLILYILIGYVLILSTGFISEQFPHSFLKWLSLRLDILYFLYLIIGFCTIFHYFWQKPWRYLKEVIQATKMVHQQNDEAIELSEPLKDIEKQMNQIKMSILLSQQVVKEAESKKNELVMYLAHDIRTPLTSVIGYLSLLDESPEIPDLQKEKYIEIALKKAQRLEMLMNEFFEITRYNTQQIKLNCVKVDLYYMLLQLIDEFYPVLSAKGNFATLQADENISVYADSEKLARVFNNILKNAASYSYPNTEIIICAEVKNDRVYVTFINHSATIPSDQLEIIFNKFSRLDDSRQSDSGGTGLGLSIAKEIIGLHKGEIFVCSENDTVRFDISLPAFS